MRRRPFNVIRTEFILLHVAAERRQHAFPRILRLHPTLNIFAEAEDGLYERMEENFREITMPSEQVEKLLSESGFEVLEVREYLTNREPGAQSDKLMFCARKK